MTSAYSFDGMVCVILLFICSCAYMRRVVRLKSLLFSDKKGFWGIFYKSAVIGIRLHYLVSILCAASAIYFLAFN